MLPPQLQTSYYAATKRKVQLAKEELEEASHLFNAMFGHHKNGGGGGVF